MKKDIKKIILFLTVFVIVVFLLCRFMPIAKAQEIEYDPPESQQAEVFKLLTWETKNCMDESAINLIRMGQRDLGEMASFLAKACGSQFYKYSTVKMKIDKDRVTRLLFAMAIKEITNVPGVKIKK